MVVLHTSLWLRQAEMERIPAISTLNIAFEDVRMPLFVAMSGLFAARWIAADRDRFFGVKVSTLAWVFVIWQVPMIAYRIIGGQILPGMTETGLGQQLDTWAWSLVRANAELWFLWALVAFFLVARMVRRVPTVPLLAVAAAVSMLFSSVLWHPAGFAGPGWFDAAPVPAIVLEMPTGGDLRHLIGTGFYKAPAYLVFFLAAARCSGMIRDGATRLPRAVWAMVAAGWVVVFAWFGSGFATGTAAGLGPALGLAPSPDSAAGMLLAETYAQWTEWRGDFGTEFLVQLAGLLGGVATAVTLSYLRPVAHVLGHVGRTTLPIYLSHTTTVVTVACLMYLFAPALLDAPAAPITVFAVAGVSIVVGLAIGRLGAGTWLLQAPAPVRRALAGRGATGRRFADHRCAANGTAPRP